MIPKALDSLQSQEDRAAIAAAVGKQLAPPYGLARIYGRLVFESHQAQIHDEAASGGQEQIIAKATADQVEWLGGEFRRIFLEAAFQMLQWCHRFRLSHPTQEWSPEAWVSAARDLGAEAELLCQVITRADALSWDAWMQAFSKDQDWTAQWFGWENAFASAPRLASRWLEVILSHEDGLEDPDRISRLSFSRGRIWQKIHANQAAGAPVGSSQGWMEYLRRRVPYARSPVWTLPRFSNTKADWPPPEGPRSLGGFSFLISPGCPFLAFIPCQ